MASTRVRIFYPADPLGIVPGGIDTFIRGLLKWAPEDIEFSLVGMSTDAVARPVRRWTRCALDGRGFDFYPAVHVPEPGRRSRIPLSARFTWNVARQRSACDGGCDVLEFHRIEPAVLYRRDPRPKNAFFHVDMESIRTERQSDIVWRRMPGAYFALEARIIRTFASVWCVSERVTESVRRRYPDITSAVRFTPTWVDPDVHRPLPAAERRRARAAVEAELGLDHGAFRIITVGRLDGSKDPHLLLSAAGRLVRDGTNLELLFVGDGVLRSALEKRVQDEGLASRVRFTGLRGAAQVASLLQAADCFALSSAYEGMPIAMLEALAAGLPVVSTDVGEVGSVLVRDVNGEIAAERSAAALAAGLDRVRRNLGRYSAERCSASVGRFTPSRVLEPIYANYRALRALGQSERR